MSRATLELERLLALSTSISPRLRKSKLWRRAAQRALQAATSADLYTLGAREGSLEDEECEDPVEPMSIGSDLDAMLERLLKRPPKGISPNSMAETNVVKLTRSKRSSRT